MYNNGENNHNNNEEATTFLDAINKYAQQQKEEILKEVEEFKAKELEKAEIEAMKHSYRLIQSSIAKVKREIAGETSALRLENKKKLLLQREKITDDVFYLVIKELIAFKKTDKYFDWIVKKAESMIDILGSNRVVFCLCEEDMKYADKLIGCLEKQPKKEIKVGSIIKDHLEKKKNENREKDNRENKNKYKVIADKTIKIGGIKGINAGKTLIADETFDSRLQIQREWFEENSGLYI